jgi:hypothetical protein
MGRNLARASHPFDGLAVKSDVIGSFLGGQGKFEAELLSTAPVYKPSECRGSSRN